jgi:hypothetical protein
MTLDEAKLILNLKNATEAEKEELVRVSRGVDMLGKQYVLEKQQALTERDCHLRTMSISSLRMRHQRQRGKQEVEVAAFTFSRRLYEREKG